MLASAAFTIVGAATASTAYLEPSTYAPAGEETITLEAAFNDYCCVPKYAVRSDAYIIIEPDGNTAPLDRIETFRTMTVLEHRIQNAGTTRFSTGERLGRKGEYVFLNGQYNLINSDDAEPLEIPTGTPILTSQTATVTDTYVTFGEPTWQSVLHSIGRLAMQPIQHPSSLNTGQRFDLRVTFDGEPLVGQAVILTREGQNVRRDIGERFVTDATGHVSVPLELIGTHLLMVRIQAPAPEDADTDIRSYTTALTFNVE
jgi:hypothetical protein